MLKRPGQRKGDMPRYFDWKEKPRRMRSSLKYFLSSSSSERQGASVGSSFSISGFARSRQFMKGDSRKGRKRSSLERLSVMKRWKFLASSGEKAAMAASMRTWSPVARSSLGGPPLLLPKRRRYWG